MKRLEQLVSAATDKIVEAIRRQSSPSMQLAHDALRVDLLAQVTSQAPKGAIGYRLVLPSRSADDAPRLSPKRSRERTMAWYSIAPFEYPDDFRLRDGCWYRILWIDAQGQRIRRSATEPSPALYFFLGPSHRTSDSADGRTQTSQSSEAIHSPPSAEPAPQSRIDSIQEDTAPSSVPVSAPAAIGGPDPAQVDVIKVSSGTAPPTAAAPPSHVSTNAGISAETEAAFFKLLDSFPPIPPEYWPPVYAFVMQVPWMIWLASEDRRRDALVNGQPPPQMPILNLSAKENETIERLLLTAPPHFILLCKQVFAFLQQHGTDVLERAPIPFHPLADEQQKQILRALRDPNSRSYLEYICRFQNAQFLQQKLPEEPAVKLSSNQRRELKKLLVDLRAVLFFKRHALPGA